MVVATSWFVLTAELYTRPLLVHTNTKVVGTISEATRAEVTSTSLVSVERLMVEDPTTTISLEDVFDDLLVTVLDLTTADVMVEPEESVVVT